MNAHYRISRQCVQTLFASFVVALTLLTTALPVGALTGSPPAGTRVVLIDVVDAPPLPADLHILEDYGAFVMAEVAERDLPTLQRQYLVDLLPERTAVSLNGWVWDTQQGEPAIPAGLRAALDDPYFLVQFYGPVRNEWLDALEELGVTFLGYHPNFTYIVRMDPLLLERVRQAHGVQWVGAYHPAYRLASDTAMQLALTYEGWIAIHIRGFPEEDPAALLRDLQATGIGISSIVSHNPPHIVTWTVPQNLPQLAAVPGVYRVEPLVPAQLDNERAVQVMHTWNIWRANRNGLSQDLMGAGQTAGMVDSGLDDNDTTPLINDFYDYTNGGRVSRIGGATAGNGCGVQFSPCTPYQACRCVCYVDDDANSSGHGTHVAGSIVGNGYNSLLQRSLQDQARSSDPTFDYAWGVGQAPEANLAFSYVAGRIEVRQGNQWQVYAEGTLCGLDFGDVYATWLNVYNNGARVVNNSWGGGDPSYSDTAITADQVMWNYQDYLIVASAGNDGPGASTVTPPGTAKNILTVGAAGNHRSVWVDSQTASLLTDFSSRGPVSTSGDTRYMPSIVAPGADVLSTRSTAIPNTTVGLWQNEPGDGDGDGHLDYAWSGGTSMSAPNVTGAAIIVRDYFQDVQGLGNTTPPSAALIKAALLNGAVDMGYGYEANTSTYPYGGRNMQGWGMVNVEQSITPRAPRSFFYDDFTNITNSIHQSTCGMDSSGDYVQYTVTVVDSSEPLRITVTWTDPQTGSSGYMVNDLNLLVTAPNGSTQYLGNVFSGSWSVTGGSYDAANNTEAVYIQNPAVGTWTIRVTDQTHGSGTQPFALVISGGLGTNPSYTRTCSGITSCSGRMGTSAQPYYPSIRPTGTTAEHVAAGGSFVTTFRLTNWGTNADTISLSSAATTMTGAGAAGFTVTFNPAGPFSLASGASVDVQATINVGSGVSNGAYDVSLIATSAGTGNRRDVQVIGVNVLPDTDLSNQMRLDTGTVSTPGAQVSPSFWVCPSTPTTMWVAYLNAEDHLGAAAEVYAARSTDGGVTWTRWQVDGGDGYHYYAPAIAGRADCSSVTVAWVRTTSTVSASSYWLYARTYSSGTWGAQMTLDSLLNGSYFMADPAVIYDNNGDILVTWLHYTGTASSSGVYWSVSTNNGSSWSAAAGAVTGAVHRYPALTLDTINNHVWMAFSYSGTTRDIYVKYWNGNTNTWNATNTVVANTGERENHPAIHYANGRLWVAWNRYTDYSNATPRLYYTYSTSTLPNITWGTTYGPYGTRLAEHVPPSITGDATYTYIAYLAYTDSYRGGNVYVLRAPASGGAPNATYQLSATVDDPPLYARGNAGTPQLRWATTTVGGNTVTGPTLLYSKNAPDTNPPDYSGNLGTAQTLFNREENFDLYLAQVGAAPTAVEVLGFSAVWERGDVRLAWETVSEVDLLGFNVLRSDDGGPYAPVNDGLIPAENPGQMSGARYTWRDTTVQPGVAYRYLLQDVDVNGYEALHGPVTPGWPVYLPTLLRQ